MSEDIPTASDGVTIHSTAHNGAYHLSVDRGEYVINRGSYPVGEYGKLLRELWEGYLERGERPRLLGHTLTDDGLAIETIHFLAPNSFYGPCSDEPLNNSREQFVYWLKTQLPRIQERIGEEEAVSIDGATDYILALHLGRNGKPFHAPEL